MIPAGFIIRIPRQDQGNIDTRAANCAGFVPGGNCASNPVWNMPSAAWWTFPFTVSVANPNGFDFAGGSVVSQQALPAVNATIVQSATLRLLGPHQRTDRTVTNCNCGPYSSPAVANCYANCNCNCNCACDCAGRD